MQSGFHSSQPYASHRPVAALSVSLLFFPTKFIHREPTSPRALDRMEGAALPKPPAFQFYAKDWRSSATVRQMSRQERGDYIDLLAAAWDSEDPGKLPLPIEIAAKSAGLDPRVARNFLTKFPRCFEEIDGKLVSRKLAQQFERISKFAESASLKGQKGAEARWHKDAPGIAQALPNDGIAVAVASAVALSQLQPPLTPPNGGDEKTPWSEFKLGGGTVRVRVPKGRRLFTGRDSETMVGSRPEDWVELLKRRGFEAEVVR